MPRIRQHSQGRTSLDAPPPIDVLPEALAALIAERHRLRSELDAASTEAAELRHHKNEDDHKARQADAAAATNAVRAGNGDGSATPHQDALAARRHSIGHRVAALTDAVQAVEVDIIGARDQWERTGEPARAAAAARAKVTKARDSLDRTLADALQAIAVDEWVTGLLYDTSHFVAPLDLVPGLRDKYGNNASHLDQPTTAAAVLAALTDI